MRFIVKKNCPIDTVELTNNEIELLENRKMEGILYANKNIKEVRLPVGLKKVPAKAFSFCDNLERVKIPEGVEVIGDGAFYGCKNLKEITFPSSLKKISTEAFESCRKLKKIEIPEGVEIIDKHAFYDCEKLKEIKLPSGLKQILTGAFHNCKSLEKIEIPEKIKEIAASTFSGCKKLKEIKLPSKLKKISDDAFCDCFSLEKIEIPEGVTIISEQCFASCHSLKEVILPSSLQYILDRAFLWNYNIKEIKLPKNLKVIGEDAFACCTNLENVLMPEGLIRIEKKAFDRCEKLKEIKLPLSLKTIGSCAFEMCKILERLDIPNDIEFLDKFSLGLNLDSINEITLPYNLKKFDYYIPKNIMSLEIVGENRVILSKELKSNNKACNLFKIFPEINMEVLFEKKEELLETIAKINEMPNDIVVSGKLINNNETLKMFLNAGYKLLESFKELMPKYDEGHYYSSEEYKLSAYRLAMLMGVMEKDNVTINVQGKDIPVNKYALKLLKLGVEQNRLDVQSLLENLKYKPVEKYNEEFLRFFESKINSNEENQNELKKITKK